MIPFNVNLIYRPPHKTPRGGSILLGTIKVYFRRYGGINKWKFWKYSKAGKRIDLYTISLSRGSDIIESLKRNADLSTSSRVDHGGIPPGDGTVQSWI